MTNPEQREKIARDALAAADRIVPVYRSPPKGRSYSCCGIVAKRWQAAWDGACIALGGDPAEYRR